ncbi:hypothetical protein G9A89_021181 [Geosiphon pyriformis]|nr:hypothetical protein G9A89_021181 [Geosiphon pyriformis]
MSSEISTISLRVDIIEGKELVAKDRNGYSDPYVVLQIGDEIHQTQVVNKNLNPRWDASFETPVSTREPPKEILLTCWDKDAFGKDYMGEIKVSLQELWQDGYLGYDDPENKVKWYPLQNISRPKESSISGAIAIKVGLINPTNQYMKDDDWTNIWQGFSKLEITPQVFDDPTPTSPTGTFSSVSSTSSQKNGRRHDSRKRASISSSSTNSSILGLTFLEVLRAEELPPEKSAVGIGYDMDPFVVVSFSKQTFRTRIIPHSLSPIWNEKLYFPVKKHEAYYDIKFSLYDWDKFTNNDLIGICHFPIQGLIEIATANGSHAPKEIESGMTEYVVPLELKTKDKYEDISPKLYLRAQFIPYERLRHQFWHALAKVYDSDDNGVLNFIEVSTMLSSLGSSLSDNTIASFFKRFGKNPQNEELSFEELCVSLEKRMHDDDHSLERAATADGGEAENEHLVYITNCPICHKPDLANQTETDIITHIAICASTDWANVDKFVVGDFVTESEAQRKWVSKVISKVGYGSFKIGANNANIIVQDRRTGQLVEEKMPTYIRLAIRLLYKGVRPSQVETKTTRRLLENLSIKQGKKFDAPQSIADIAPFIEFHQLSIEEILNPLDSFKNFNEFFYRKLKPTARTLDSPDDPTVLVSPADCRMMAFPTVDEATKIWIKGQNFSLERLFGDVNKANEFIGGSLGIFRLAPQDYHRFHIPVDGFLSEPHPIPGAYYTVNPMAIRSELDVYGENKRAVSYIDSPQFGKVALVAIGAMMVGSILFTSTPLTNVKRFEEHGYFAFGGSTIILCFQENRMEWDEDLLANAEQALETLVRVGSHVGRAIPQE